MKRTRNIIAFTGGGSGGHVFPAFGVIDALDPAILEQNEMVWVGSHRGVERRYVQARGLRYFGVSAGKLRRYLSLRNLFDAFRFVFGIVEAFFLMLRLRPRLLFSKGGFVSVAPVIAAGLLKIPVIAHESDYDPGLATRINLRFTDIVCIPFEESAEFFRGSRARVEVTGNPVRKDVLTGMAGEGRKVAGFDRLGLKELPVLLVQGGSLGARQINRALAAAAPRLLEKMLIIHQTGDENWDIDGEVARAARDTDSPSALPAELRDRYFHRPFFAEEYPHILAAADLVLSRSGASAVWELGLCAKPAVFVPLVAGARGDQLRNARYVEGRGAARVIADDTGLADLGDLLLGLMADAGACDKMSRAWKAVIHNDGAARIAALLAGLLSGTSGGIDPAGAGSGRAAKADLKGRAGAGADSGARSRGRGE